MTIKHKGSCHCEAIKFTVEADLEAETILNCNCSICRMKGNLHLIVPEDAFELTQGEYFIEEYRFGTENAVHIFCRDCGIHPFYIPRSHPDKINVNVRCLEGVDLGQLEVEPFDGANWEENVEDIREN